ncbi:MAG TPA: MerR family transcriptional regulator [bacterium]|nr:MerR family transcriptional regulator [bacterium]
MNKPVQDGSPADSGVQCRMEEVVRRTGLTPRAIRYYEEFGLLHPSGRTAGGFRLFTEGDIALLMRINELQTLLGFSLAEVKQTLHVDSMLAEVREAYFGTSDPNTRLALLDQAFGLIQSQIRIIDERMVRLAKLREEQLERLSRVRGRRAELGAADETASAGATGLPQAGAHNG